MKFLPAFISDLRASVSRGFTLVELLVVVAILGVLGAAIVIAIDPVDKIRGANDATVINHVGSIATAAESYAATHDGYYPDSLQDLVTSGDLKSMPKPPGGYGITEYPFTTYTDEAGTLACANDQCARVITFVTLQSKKYKNAATPAGPKYIWDSVTGEKCFKQTAGTTNTCP